ncbi:hypothetical protein B296_00012417 [Ensete ventricosum]|uniref:Uncharacterized protein n=1 Tax=Ensete ventricosum TaxID=4639 RepID=A0A427AYR5_ENSVE|nr:hypothetical protein B296_00012417 [Ensete ventricosum]
MVLSLSQPPTVSKLTKAREATVFHISPLLQLRHRPEFQRLQAWKCLDGFFFTGIATVDLAVINGTAKPFSKRRRRSEIAQSPNTAMQKEGVVAMPQRVQVMQVWEQGSKRSHTVVSELREGCLLNISRTNHGDDRRAVRPFEQHQFDHFVLLVLSSLDLYYVRCSIRFWQAYTNPRMTPCSTCCQLQGIYLVQIAMKPSSYLPRL